MLTLTISGCGKELRNLDDRLPIRCVEHGCCLGYPCIAFRSSRAATASSLSNAAVLFLLCPLGLVLINKQSMKNWVKTWYSLPSTRTPVLAGWGLCAAIAALFVGDRIGPLRRDVFSRIVPPWFPLLGPRYAPFYVPAKEAKEDEGDEE